MASEALLVMVLVFGPPPPSQHWPLLEFALSPRALKPRVVSELRLADEGAWTALATGGAAAGAGAADGAAEGEVVGGDTTAAATEGVVVGAGAGLEVGTPGP